MKRWATYRKQHSHRLPPSPARTAVYRLLRQHGILLEAEISEMLTYVYRAENVHRAIDQFQRLGVVVRIHKRNAGGGYERLVALQADYRPNRIQTYGGDAA